MTSVVAFFNTLRSNNGAIWIENKDIRLSTPRSLQTPETRGFILEHEKDISSILNENKIFTKQDFINKIILKNSTGKSYPLSFAQERLWFIDQYEGGSSAYHVPSLYELDSETSKPDIIQALEQIVGRHEVLRSTIEQDGNSKSGMQRVHDKPLPVEDVYLKAEEDFKSLVKSDVNRLFDLSKEYPIRIKFYTIASSPGELSPKRFLLINMHHIASDGYSMDIFQKELAAYYTASIKKDSEFNLPPLEIQYKDYAVWQRNYLNGEVLDKQLNYWKKKLTGYHTLEIPTDYIRPVELDYKGAHLEFRLGEENSRRLRTLAKNLNVTLHSVMLSAVNILLGKYTGQQDIMIGSPIANRHRRQTENLIGFFVNMQANRTLLTKTQSYTELIEHVYQDQVEAQSNQDLPFEKLVDELAVERDPSRHPLFQVTFVVQSFGNKADGTDKQSNYLKFLHTEGISETGRFDLSITIDDGAEEMVGQLNYATSLFKKETVERFIQHFTYLLNELTLAPDEPYSRITLISKQEYQEIVYDWNATSNIYPTDKTIHEMVEVRAADMPEAIAVVYEQQQLTYRELNEKSNQLASYIREEYKSRTGQELVADTLVAICLERSLEMIVGILAILKAGAAYVPIDPKYPHERVAYLLEDTDVKLILSQRSMIASDKAKLPEDKVIYIELTEAFYTKQTKVNLPRHSQPDNLAYVIYTSGTTGNPKGVMVEHKGIINLIVNKQNSLGLDSESKVLQFSSLNFDASAWEIFSTLYVGGRLFLISDKMRQDGKILFNFLLDNTITFVLLPPAYLSTLPVKPLPFLKTLVVGGDTCSVELMKSWSPDRRFLNAYGPTEITVCATIHEYVNGDSSRNIGKPINNAKVYVLDADHKPVPIGVVGELYVGGAGVARGYLNRTELTAERFILNPFATKYDTASGYTRLYKTGDLVKWLSNGDIEYIGRNDNQVKIRGYRIELGEIENALMQIAGIKQACVISKERKINGNSSKYLVGYYVWDNNFSPDSSSEVLNDWENLYNLVYTEEQKTIEANNIEADFSGWNSYITGGPIPLTEMEHWRNDIVSIITGKKPQRVLEVGVGSGLLMYPLLKEINSYVGLDISKSVIDKHKKYLEDKTHNVELHHLRADQIDQLPQDTAYDMVIINSVSQYFPNIKYFENVVDKSIMRLSKTGSIFLGDIRNFDLHKELIKEKLDYQQLTYTQQDLERVALKENELLISPSYFAGLENKFSDIKIQIFQRNGSYVNELSKYRYDVLITKQNSTNDKNNSGNSMVPESGKLYNTPNLSQIRKEEILKQLAAVLPEYMIPGSIIELEQLPLTVGGKLDKHALPDPDFRTALDEYVAPVTETEIALCKIWQEVLGTDRVGVTDNFFRIGGDSILSIQVSGRIRQAGFPCQVKDVFEHKTIARLADYLNRNNASKLIESEQGILNGDLQFLPIQQWFLEKVESGALPYPNYWNHSFIIKVNELDTDKLTGVIEKLVAYHDVLRIRYVKEGDTNSIQWKQVYQESIPIPELKKLNISSCSETEVHKILSDWQSGFNLEQGPLFQIGYLHGYRDGTARIYLAIHHMLVDGVSWRILSEDIKTVYEGKQLPVKGSSYRQWINAIKNYPVQYPMESDYWSQQISSLPPYSMEDAQQPSEIFIELEEETSRILIQEASKAYHTEVNDLLLTALAYTLKEINGNDIQGITLEGHGREDIYTSIDHSRTLGWFTSMFPVKLEVKQNLGETIQCIKENLRSIPNKGIGFGVFATSEATAYGFKDLAPISFNYLGQFDTRQAGYWQVVSEDSGQSLHPGNTDQNVININGIVSNGKMGFHIVTKLGAGTTRQVGEILKEELMKIALHCKEKQEKEGSSYTPSDFDSVKISQNLLNAIASSCRSTKNELAYIYPATSLQQGFIYHALSQQEDDAYRVQMLLDYHEKLDIEKYLKAWEYCIARYPILRTAFNWEEELVQIIYKYGNLSYQLHDISHFVTQQQRDEAIREIEEEDRRKSFDLRKPTLLRLHIIKQSEENYTVLKTEHHSIMDGWSGPLLLATLHNNYQLLKLNKQVLIKEDTAYQRTQEYISKHKAAAQDYWKNNLSQMEAANNINSLLTEPIDLKTYKQVEEAAAHSLEITGDFYKSIKSFSKNEGITLNVMVQFIWHKLLQVYSNSPQSIVGTTVSGRDLPVEGIEESVGLYINTLPLIIDWRKKNTIREQLHEIQNKITELNTHNFSDLAKLQKEGERLFHSLLVYENYPVPKEEEEETKINIGVATDKVDYPLSILAYEFNDTLVIKLQYDRYHLTDEKANQHIKTLLHIVHQVVEAPDNIHSAISLLNDEAYQEIIYKWNTQLKEFPVDTSVCELFEAQVEKTPEKIALVFEGVELSYKELNEKSNQLARHIQEQYKKITNTSLLADTLIGICVERSLEMVIGILAVLKSGGAYVPIDPGYPLERITYMLEDTGLQLVLSQRELIETGKVKFPEEKLVYIGLTEDIYKEQAKTNLTVYSKANNLAYVIYTSGTTGKPKGVMVEQQQIIAFVSENNFIDYSLTNVVAGVSSYVFDGSIFDIFFTLMNGKTLVLIDKRCLLDVVLLNDQLTANCVDTIFITTALFNSLVQNQSDCLSDLKQVLFGGELCNLGLINKFKQSYKNTSLIHVYGPTENIVYSTYCNLNVYDTNKVAPIGTSLNDKKLYVLDSSLNPVPVGAIGELYIGGAGVARGYLNRQDLTSERFIPNPFSTEGDKEKKYTRLYKTGDLVRWLADGNIEYIGRNDDQVKIRGYRIELGEIETAMLQIDAIKQVCVLARERKVKADKYLIAYYVLSEGMNHTDQDIIREKLMQVLPEYMVPSLFVPMENIPLTINGKINKEALPDIDPGVSEKYVAPVTENEMISCKIWQDVLGIERVGTTDNFFKIGGNSILAIQAAHRMKKELNVDIKVADVFRMKNITTLLNDVCQKHEHSQKIEWEV